jgi:hypothetical protein
VTVLDTKAREPGFESLVRFKDVFHVAFVKYMLEVGNPVDPKITGLIFDQSP